MHGSSDHITCAGDVLSSEFYAAARFMGMEYVSGIEPQDAAQKVFNALVEYDKARHRSNVPAWVLLLAMSCAYAKQIGEDMPEAWWIAASGHLPCNCVRYEKLTRMAAKLMGTELTRAS